MKLALINVPGGVGLRPRLEQEDLAKMGIHSLEDLVELQKDQNRFVERMMEAFPEVREAYEGASRVYQAIEDGTPLPTDMQKIDDLFTETRDMLFLIAGDQRMDCNKFDLFCTRLYRSSKDLKILIKIARRKLVEDGAPEFLDHDGVPFAWWRIMRGVEGEPHAYRITDTKALAYHRMPDNLFNISMYQESDDDHLLIISTEPKATVIIR
jgi:hypothetical protein